MTLIVEDGTGIKSANGYISVEEYDAYHRDRDGELSKGGEAKQAAIIKATDYIDKRFGHRFKGIRLHADLKVARVTLTATALPADTETITVGSITYTFVDTLSGAANEVLIQSSVDATLATLILAINLTGEEGTDYGVGTVENEDANAQAFTGDRVLIYATVSGTAGNSVAVSTTSASLSFNFPTFQGGSDEDAGQPLEFPRRSAYSRYGRPWQGIPLPLRQATAEYARRVLSGTELWSDPALDASGRIVNATRTKVGPIETELSYEPGGALQLPAYPAADRLLTDLLVPAGGVLR